MPFTNFQNRPPRSWLRLHRVEEYRQLIRLMWKLLMSHGQYSHPRKKEDYVGTYVSYRDWKQKSAEARYKKEGGKHAFLWLLTRIKCSSILISLISDTRLIDRQDINLSFPPGAGSFGSFLPEFASVSLVLHCLLGEPNNQKLDAAVQLRTSILKSLCRCLDLVGSMCPFVPWWRLC